MKKNFFKKKLASGLALALVIASLAPAGISASAATATKIVKQGGAKAPTVLYVGDKGTDYSLSNVYKSNTYSWKISNSKIATINAKTGVVTAKTPGTVKIRVTARKAKTNKWLKDFTMKLYIKQRVDSVDIGSDDFSLAIDEVKDLNAVKDPKTSTDVLVYASSDEKVATVDAKTGIVKAVAPGEATITVYAKGLSSSPITSKYNRTDSVKVTVLDGILGVKQTTATKLEVTLASDQSEKLTKDNLVITDVNDVKQIIKELSFSDDGKVAKVELYVSLTDKAVYTVSYADTSKDFTASIGEVAKVVVTGKTIQYGTATGFDVKLYDANDVEVTSDTALENNVTFSYDTSKAYIDQFNSTDKYKITAFNFNEAITVTATYHTYKYVDGKEVTFENIAVFNSVEEIPNVAADITYTLSKDSADWKNVKASIPAGDTGYKLFIKAKSQDGTDLTEADFTYESTDIDVLTVVKTLDSDGDDVVYVYPGKTGTAYVKATYGKTVKLLAITVGAESKVATVVPNVTNVTLYSSLVGDAATITLTGKDQYGSEVDYSGEVIAVDHVSGDSESIINPSYPAANKVTFTISNTVTSANDGTNTYKLTFLDKVVVVYVKVVNVDNTTVSYINVERSAATVDAVLTEDNATSGTDVSFTVYGYNTSGQKVQVMTGADITVKFNGSDVNASSAADGSYVDALGVATFAALDTAGTTVTQAAVGTYVVEATATVAGVVKKATTSFAVTNSQAVPTVTRTATKVDAGTTLEVVKEGFEVKLNGTTLNDSVITAANVIVGTDENPTSVTAGQTAYVKSITVSQVIGGKTINQTINIGLSLIAK